MITDNAIEVSLDFEVPMRCAKKKNKKAYFSFGVCDPIPSIFRILHTFQRRHPSPFSPDYSASDATYLTGFCERRHRDKDMVSDFLSVWNLVYIRPASPCFWVRKFYKKLLGTISNFDSTIANHQFSARS